MEKIECVNHRSSKEERRFAIGNYVISTKLMHDNTWTRLFRRIQYKGK